MRKKGNKNNYLTHTQEKFCVEYVSNKCSGYEAYLRATDNGVAKPTAQRAATRLLKNPLILKRIQELRDQAAGAMIADLKEIKEFLTATLREETTEEVLMTEGVEKGVTETVKYRKKADIRSRLKAADQLIRLSGGYQDTMNLTGGVQVVIHDDLED